MTRAKQLVVAVVAALAVSGAWAQVTVTGSSAGFTPGGTATIELDYDFNGEAVTGLSFFVTAPAGWGTATRTVTPAATSPTPSSPPQIQFGFSLAEFGNLPTSGTISLELDVPASAEDAEIVKVAAFPVIGGSSVPTQVPDVTVNPPPGPTVSNPDPATDEFGDALTDVDFTVVANGTDTVTVAVDLTPIQGETLAKAGFIVANASFDDGSGRWVELDDLTNNPTQNGGSLNSLGEDDVIEFAQTSPQMTSVVPLDEGDVALTHGFAFSPAGAAVPSAGGTFTMTWTPPAGLVTKDNHPQGKVFILDIGAQQSNLGEGGQEWVVRVLAPNQAPVATDDTGDVDENGAADTIDLLANDTDPDTVDVPGLAVASLDLGGTVGLVTDNGDGTVDYSANGQFEGLAAGETTTDTFGYVLTDGTDTDAATVTVTITGENDDPTASAPTSAQLTVINATVPVTVTVVDPDSDDSWADLSDFVFTNLPAGITVAKGSTPNTLDVTVGDVAVQSGLTFDFEVTDNSGSASGVVTVTIDVISNQLPAFSGGPDVTTINENGTVTFDVTFDDSGNTETGDDGIKDVTFSVDGQQMEVDSNATQTGAFSASFSFTPDQDFVLFGTDGGSKTVDVTVMATAHQQTGAPRTETFSITVNDVNRPPTVDQVDALTLLEDAAAETVNLAGIADGDADTQTLTVTAVSDNTALIPNPTVTYASADATGSLAFTPVANANGTATITVTVSDDAGTANGGDDTTTMAFVVTVTAVNDEPTVDQPSDETIDEDAGAQTVALTNVTDGDADVEQGLTVTAVSDNTDLIPNPSVDQQTFELTYESNQDAFGTATITVTVMDDGGTENGGDDTVTTTFTVTVNPINDAPVPGPDNVGLFTKAGEDLEDVAITGSDVDNDDGELSFLLSATADGTFAAVGTTVDAGLELRSPGGDLIGTVVKASAARDASELYDLIVDDADFSGPVEFFFKVQDQEPLLSTTAGRVSITIGTPLWYPFVSWSGDEDGWYNVKIKDAGDATVFETNVNGTALSVTDYFLAGFGGLTPGNYSSEVVTWDPATDTLGTTPIAAQPSPIEVTYGGADAPTDSGITDQGNGCYEITFVAGNARGYNVVIMGTNTDYLREITQVFRPDSEGVVPLNQPVTLEVKLTAADSYNVFVRGFNPLDEDNGLADFNGGDADGFSEITGSPITLGADQDAGTPGAPQNLLPKSGDLITLADGATTITRTLRWDPVAGATSYFVYLASSTAAPLLNFVNVGTATSVTVTMSAGTYSWMVVADTAGATPSVGPWSAPQQFTVAGSLEGPVATGLTLVGSEVRLVMATGSAAPASVIVRHFAEGDADGSWDLLGELTIGANNAIQGLPTLPTGTNYFRIRAIGGDGSTGPSQLFSVDVPATP